MVCFSIRGWGIIIPISGNNNNNIISSNTTWYGANIYWVFDDVTIKNNATLDIEPGTNILFFANSNNSSRSLSPVLNIADFNNP